MARRRGIRDRGRLAAAAALTRPLALQRRPPTSGRPLDRAALNHREDSRTMLTSLLCIAARWGPGHARLVWTAAVVGAALVAVGGSAEGRSMCQPAWRVVPNPSVGGDKDDDHELRAVDAVSPSDAWAVGFREFRGFRALTEHWDGQAWKVVRVPRGARPLYGVAAISRRDVWAVGQDLVLHRVGNRWRVARFGGLFLNSVTAVSTHDVWAVGRRGSPDRASAQITYWNGRRWRETDVGFAGELFAVTALARNDVWAVGAERVGEIDRALILHWDGQSWKSSPAPPGTFWLEGVTALARDDVWAGGRGVILHWNGRRWQRFPQPPRPLFKSRDAIPVWEAIEATSPRDLWVADSSEGVFHWNGTVWRRTWLPDRTAPSVAAITALTPRDVWAVGSSFGSPSRPAIAHYSCP